MSAKLLCRTGPQAGLTFRIRDVARIGRGAGIEVDLPLQGVSSLHATIVFTTGSYWIEDAGSTNGTFVNGRRVTKERLRHLDVLSLGASADLVFVLKTTAPGEEQSVMIGPSLAAARLIAVDGPEAGTVREIPKGLLTVGRVTACNLVIDSAAVSKMHARLERMGDILTVVDLGSANGTFVNGVKVTAAPLADGDRLVFAAVREFRVEIEMAAMGGFGQSTVSLPRPTSAGDSAGVAQDWRTRYDFSPGENVPDEKGSPRDPLPRSPIAGAAAKPSVAKAPLPPRTAPPSSSPKPSSTPSSEATPAVPKVATPKPAEAAPRTAEAPKAPALSAPSAPPVPPRPSVSPVVTAPTVPAAVVNPPKPPPPAPAVVVAPPVPPRPAAPAPPIVPAPIAPASAVSEPEEDREGLTERIPHISQVVLDSPTGTYRVGAGSHYVGRHVTCAISIQETKISRLHATITVTANEVVLKDLQSANGTYLNGERITEPKPLKSGDTIIFAEAPFKVSIEY